MLQEQTLNKIGAFFSHKPHHPKMGANQGYKSSLGPTASPPRPTSTDHESRRDFGAPNLEQVVRGPTQNLRVCFEILNVLERCLTYSEGLESFSKSQKVALHFSNCQCPAVAPNFLIFNTPPCPSCTTQVPVPTQRKTHIEVPQRWVLLKTGASGNSPKEAKNSAKGFLVKTAKSGWNDMVRRGTGCWYIWVLPSYTSSQLFPSLPLTLDATLLQIDFTLYSSLHFKCIV